MAADSVGRRQTRTEGSDLIVVTTWGAGEPRRGQDCCGRLCRMGGGDGQENTNIQAPLKETERMLVL